MSDRSPAIAAFHTWAREASYGDVFVYHRASGPREQELYDYARKLSDAGLAFLFRRRTDAGLEACARRIHHETHFSLDKVSAAVKVAPTHAYLAEEGALPVGRPHKRQEIAA